MRALQKEPAKGGIGDFSGALITGGIVTVVMFALLLRDPLLFWNDDYELSILPVFADVARSWSEGHLPLLSPYSWVCSNLAGEFQYGTFSVFVNAAVVAIWKFPLTFPQQAAALSITHLFVLAVGGYLLARGREIAPRFAMVVGLVAALNGWIVCWGAIDWFGALGAFAWLPWAWWGMERATNPRFGRWRFLWPAPFIYLLVTGGFPYTVVMFALLALWLGIKTIIETRRFSSVLPMVMGVLLGLGLSAPAWLALFDYLRGSAREGGDAASHLQWVVPVRALPAFILPAWTVDWSDFSSRLMPHASAEMACGLVPPAALIGGFLVAGRTLLRRTRWELSLLALVLLISMLPSANVFRWSFRWLPFLHVILAICAAEALEMMSRELENSPWPFLKRPSTISVLLVLATGAGMWSAHAAGPFGAALFVPMFVLSVVWLALDYLVAPLSFFARSAYIGMTATTFIATYFCIPPNCGVPKYLLSQKLTQPAPLDPERLYLSVYPAAEYTYKVELKDGPIGQLVRPGSTSMWAGLRFVNGYSPIRPSGVAREYKSAIHGDFDENIARRLLDEESGPNGELALLGVDGIVVASEIAAAPQPASEWLLALKNEEASVYYRRKRLPAVRFLADSPTDLANVTPPSISILADSRNTVTARIVTADLGKPATLAFSRPYFPGYVAKLDGKALTVSSNHGLIPTVSLPAAARGTLRLVYRPWWLVAGSAVAVLASVICVSGALIAWREKKTREAKGL